MRVSTVVTLVLGGDCLGPIPMLSKIAGHFFVHCLGAFFHGTSAGIIVCIGY